MENLTYCRDLYILHSVLLASNNEDQFKQGLIALVDFVDIMMKNHEMLAKQIDNMNKDIAELKKQISEVEGTANRAANVSSCMANGIKPD